MGLFDKFTNPVWHYAVTLDESRRRIAALLITGYPLLRITLKEHLVDPLEGSGLVPQQSRLTAEIREHLLDEAIVGFLKSCDVPKSDPSGKIPDKVMSTIAEVWGLFSLADRNFRMKCPEPETLEEAAYSRDRDEARTQVLVKWTEILRGLQNNFTAEANKRWFYKAWTELSVTYLSGTIKGFTRTPDEILFKKAKSVSADIPHHRIAKTRSMLEIIAKAPLTSVHGKVAAGERKAEIPQKARDVSGDRGDADAQYSLGRELYLGLGIDAAPQDYIQAALLFRKAAEQGHTEAQFALGGMFCNGLGVPKDTSQAIIWFHKAADQGLAEAQFNLGMGYFKGDGVPEDDSQAAVWFRKAAEQGHARAQYLLGCQYERGQGVRQDRSQGVAWYRKAADQGDADAQCSLGLSYRDGGGVQQSYTQSVIWLNKAAHQGNADAQTALGYMYRDGQGVQRDDAQAAVWFRKAAEQGDVYAQVNIAFMYYEGQGVPQDYARAAHWYQKAAEQGDRGSQKNLGILYRDGEGVPQDNVESYFWLSLATRGATKTDMERYTKDRDAVAAFLSPSQLSEVEKRVNQRFAANSR